MRRHPDPDMRPRWLLGRFLGNLLVAFLLILGVVYVIVAGFHALGWQTTAACAAVPWASSWFTQLLGPLMAIAGVLLWVMNGLRLGLGSALAITGFAVAALPGVVLNYFPSFCG